MNASDSELYALWLTERDADAFSEIVYRHGAMVFGACQRILKNGADAEDVVQECFLHLAEQGKRIHTSLGGWLHTLATRRSISRLRSDSRRARREAMYQKDLPAAAEPSWDDMRELLDEALVQLSSKNRSAVVYRYLEGRTHVECAQAMGVSPSTAQYRANQGVEQLRKALRRRGVAVSSVALGSMIVSNAAQAMPAALQNSLGAIAIVGGEGLATAGASGLQGMTNLLAQTGWVKPVAGIGVAIAVVSVAVVLPIAPRDGGAGPVPEIETAMVQTPAPVASQPQPSPPGEGAGILQVNDSLQAAIEPVPEDVPANAPLSDTANAPDAGRPQASFGGFGGAVSLDELENDLLRVPVELLPEEELGYSPSVHGVPERDDSFKAGRSAREVIAAFQATLASQKSYLFRFTYSKHEEYHGISPKFSSPNVEGERKGYASGLLATDGYRVAHQFSTWGDFHGRDEPPTASDPNYFASTFDGNEKWQISRGPRRYMKRRGRGIVMVHRSKSAEIHGKRRSWVEEMKRHSNTKWLQGYFGGMGEVVRVDELLRSASVLDLRGAPEQVGGSVCEVIDFESPYGTGTLWLDPAHGYLLAQMEVYRNAASNHSMVLGVKFDEGYRAYFSLTDASFEQVDGVWFATAATVVQEYDNPHFYGITTHRPTITEIVVNPDLDAYRLFSGDDIRDGTPVAYFDPPSRVATEAYVWQDGRLVDITPENDPENPDNW